MLITHVHGINTSIDEEYCAAIKEALTAPCIDHGRKGTAAGYCLAYSHMEGGKQRNTLLHRRVYCEAAGVNIDSIKGLVVMHLCDNPRCIEPSHLKLGTQKDNMTDCMKKGRRRNKRVLKDPQKYLYREFEKYDDKDYVS